MNESNTVLQQVATFLSATNKCFQNTSVSNDNIKACLRSADAFQKNELDNPVSRASPPCLAPVTSWIGKAINIGADQSAQPEHATILKSVEALWPLMVWEIGYDDAGLPDDFRNKFAFAEIVGRKGIFLSKGFSAGLTMMAPNMYYDWHSHPAIEIYLCLSKGSKWGLNRQPLTNREFGDVIVHPSEAPHAMSSSEQPFLAAWYWAGDTQTPPRMV